MSPHELFRWIFVAIRVGFLPFALFHRIRSNLGGEKLDRWQERTFILFGLRLSGLPLARDDYYGRRGHINAR
ncbi:MAG: hypothetical protein O3C21_19090 [Verrucomicrobia bacterium]|nr:hypothetical protein [Verrucomicrobiota bacterium]